MSKKLDEQIEKLNEILAKEEGGFAVQSIIVKSTGTKESYIEPLCVEWEIYYDHQTRTWKRRCVRW